MEKYVWASVVYYAATIGGFVLLYVFILPLGGVLWGLVSIVGYLALILCLNIWRHRKHPRSIYQIEIRQTRPA
jgi:hypothetical protein